MSKLEVCGAARASYALVYAKSVGSLACDCSCCLFCVCECPCVVENDGCSVTWARILIPAVYSLFECVLEVEERVL